MGVFDMEDRELIKIAKDMVLNSYSPYSKFAVGAAILTENNKVFTGANVENLSYGATVCGERVAACKSVIEGEKVFKAIAIASSGDDFVLPCGICRQFLSEFASADMKVLCTNKKGEVKEFKLYELLPNAFCKF
jgi:cytidine deaminase